MNSKFEVKANTYKKLDAILSASKLKVVNRMSKIKLEASHYYMMSLFSKNIFEKAFQLYQFESDVYRNDYKSLIEINIVFLEEKQTLSHSREKVLKAFRSTYGEDNLNLIVTNDLDLSNDLPDLNYILIPPSQIMSMSHEITQRYVTKKYKKVNIISSLVDNDGISTILPMAELKQVAEYKYDGLLKADVNFYPSLDVVIERAFLDYVKCLIKYFFIYGQYASLRKTLLKHENSLDSLDAKLDDLRKEINKLRQSKITAEILEASEVSSD